jgi:hypothetical protein
MTRASDPTHKLVSLQWSGERGVEGSTTATCACGWQESASTRREAQREHRAHLARVLPTNAK